MSVARPLPVPDYLARVAREAGEPPTNPAIVLPTPPALFDFTEMLDQPSIEWLIGDLVPERSFGTLTGKWGTGKSIVALAWCMAIGTCRPWLGRTVKGGGALYIAAEGCRSERLEAYRQRWGVDQLPAVWWRKQELPLARPLHIDAILQQIEGLPNVPKLIVLDTYARCTAGLKENDASDTALAVAAADRLIRATGATVMAIHHPPHGAPGRSRGSGALDGAADTTLLLEQRESGLVLRVTKQKDGATPEPMLLRLAVSGPSVVVELDSLVDRGVGQAAAALDALRRIMVPGGVTAKEWRIATGLPERSFYRCRGELVQGQRVEQLEGKRYAPK